ncbi:MAG TPA: helix-turn-helix transcriptional regulator [Fimbriimonadaceae bacterium]|nr:helix-turn-helix transcriptional regulator [Fimbriimonadaceae bacterium]
MRLKAYSYFGEIVRVEERGSMLLTETAYEPSMHLPDHSHGSSHLAILVAGCYLERIGSNANLWFPGDAVHYRPDVQHDNLFGARPARCINLEFDERSMPPECMTNASYVPAEVRTLLSSSCQNGSIKSPDWIAEARTRIDARPSLSLGPLAEELAVHPSYLARTFRRAYGLSVGQYASLQRVRLGARLLIESESPIAEIAFDAGFFDQSHFANAFASLAGFTPAALRRIVHA